MMYPESVFYYNLIDLDSRNGDKIDTGYPLKYFDEIVKYLTNELDVNEFYYVEFLDLCRELMEIHIPFKMDIMNKLCNGFNEYGVGWKNRCVVVSGKDYKMIIDCIKKEWKLSELKYNIETDRYEHVIDDKYEPIIQSFSIYIDNTYDDYDELIDNLDRRTVNEFANEEIIDLNNEDAHLFFYPIYSSFLRDTILFGQEYDDKLREWLGNDYKWRLLYRASELSNATTFFHECRFNKGPTLIVIKSSEGCIFGGYTTQLWKDIHPNMYKYCIYSDI